MSILNNPIQLDTECRRLMETKNISYSDAFRQVIRDEQIMTFNASPETTDAESELATQTDIRNHLYEFSKQVHPYSQEKQSELCTELICINERTKNTAAFCELLQYIKRNPGTNLNDISATRDEVSICTAAGTKKLGNGLYNFSRKTLDDYLKLYRK